MDAAIAAIASVIVALLGGGWLRERRENRKQARTEVREDIVQSAEMTKADTDRMALLFKRHDELTDQIDKQRTDFDGAIARVDKERKECYAELRAAEERIAHLEGKVDVIATTQQQEYSSVGAHLASAGLMQEIDRLQARLDELSNEASRENSSAADAALSLTEEGPDGR